MSYVMMVGRFEGAEDLIRGLEEDHEVSRCALSKGWHERIVQALSKHAVSVILDIMIEDADVFGVLEAIKSNFPQVEVMVLSPENNMNWQIETFRLGGYCFETYKVEPRVLGHYLTQIDDQFDLFKIAEKTCRGTIVHQMELRLKLALEFVSQRRSRGQRLSAEELSVFFPIAQDSDSDIEILQQHLATYETKSPQLIQILVVEDELELVSTLRKNLGVLLNYSLTVAGNCKQALAIIEGGQKFNVAILDIGLPDAWGTTLIRPILSSSPDTEVVMLTAFHEFHTIQDSFRLGASDYIPKPFDHYHLQQVVSKAAQRFVYKSFLPKTAWKPMSFILNTLELRLRLLKELVNFRISNKKGIQAQELEIFLPSFKMAVSEKLNWIDMDMMKNGVVSFLLEYSRQHQLRVSVEELALLRKVRNR